MISSFYKKYYYSRLSDYYKSDKVALTFITIGSYTIFGLEIFIFDNKYILVITILQKNSFIQQSFI